MASTSLGSSPFGCVPGSSDMCCNSGNASCAVLGSTCFSFYYPPSPSNPDGDYSYFTMNLQFPSNFDSNTSLLNFLNSSKCDLLPNSSNYSLSQYCTGITNQTEWFNVEGSIVSGQGLRFYISPAPGIPVTNKNFNSCYYIDPFKTVQSYLYAGTCTTSPDPTLDSQASDCTQNIINTTVLVDPQEDPQQGGYAFVAPTPDNISLLLGKYFAENVYFAATNAVNGQGTSESTFLRIPYYWGTFFQSTAPVSYSSTFQSTAPVSYSSTKSTAPVSYSSTKTSIDSFIHEFSYSPAIINRFFTPRTETITHTDDITSEFIVDNKIYIIDGSTIQEGGSITVNGQAFIQNVTVAKDLYIKLGDKASVVFKDTYFDDANPNINFETGENSQTFITSSFILNNHMRTGGVPSSVFTIKAGTDEAKYMIDLSSSKFVTKDDELVNTLVTLKGEVTVYTAPLNRKYLVSKL